MKILAYVGKNAEKEMISSAAWKACKLARFLIIGSHKGVEKIREIAGESISRYFEIQKSDLENSIGFDGFECILFCNVEEMDAGKLVQALTICCNLNLNLLCISGKYRDSKGLPYPAWDMVFDMCSRIYIF